MPYSCPYPLMRNENEEPVIQYTLHDCYRICDERHGFGGILRNQCRFWCRTTNSDTPQHN